MPSAFSHLSSNSWSQASLLSIFKSIFITSLKLPFPGFFGGVVPGARSRSHVLSPYFSFQHHSTHSLPWNAIFLWHFWQQILLIFSVVHLSFLLCCHFWLPHIPLELKGLHFQPSCLFYIYISQKMPSRLMTSWLSILMIYIWLPTIVYMWHICRVWART